MMNGLQTLPQWRDTFGQPTGALLGFMNAVYPVAKVIGLFPATWIGDRYGRKKVLYTGFALLPIGAAVQAAAQNTPMFIVAGFLIGFATSFLSQPSPILVTELAYPTHRATATALYNTCFVRDLIFEAGTILISHLSTSGPSSPRGQHSELSGCSRRGPGESHPYSNKPYRPFKLLLSSGSQSLLGPLSLHMPRLHY